jgi:hypothetical protein
MWHLAYDLARDEGRIRAVQQASLTKPGFGFPVEPALFGSPEWWDLVERRRFPATTVEGSISRVFWASMGDWPEFTLTSADGSETNWTREGDLRRYVEGLRARVRYVELERKPDAAFTPTEGVRKVVLGIWIEQSDRRSPAIAPGPGGTGYDLEGGPGTVRHYIHLAGQASGQLVEALASRGFRSIAKPSSLGGAWVTATHRSSDLPLDGSRQTVLRVADAHAGVYEGFDLIEEASCRAEGP